MKSLILLSILLSSQAIAQKVVGGTLSKNPCQADITKFCAPNLSPNYQFKCLGQIKTLDPQCKNHLPVLAKNIEDMVSACDEDRKKLCPKAPLKEGLVFKCLQSKKEQASSRCRSFL